MIGKVRERIDSICGRAFCVFKFEIGVEYVESEDEGDMIKNPRDAGKHL